MQDNIQNERFIATADDFLRAWDGIPFGDRYGKKTSIATTIDVMEQYRRSNVDVFPGIDEEGTKRIREALGGVEYEYDLFGLADAMEDIEALDGFGRLHKERLIQVGQKIIDMTKEASRQKLTSAE